MFSNKLNVFLLLVTVFNSAYAMFPGYQQTEQVNRQIAQNQHTMNMQSRPQPALASLPKMQNSAMQQLTVQQQLLAVLRQDMLPAVQPQLLQGQSKTHATDLLRQRNYQTFDYQQTSRIQPDSQVSDLGKKTFNYQRTPLVQEQHAEQRKLQEKTAQKVKIAQERLDDYAKMLQQRKVQRSDSHGMQLPADRYVKMLQTVREGAKARESSNSSSSFSKSSSHSPSSSSSSSSLSVQAAQSTAASSIVLDDQEMLLQTDFTANKPLSFGVQLLMEECRLNKGDKEVSPEFIECLKGYSEAQSNRLQADGEIEKQKEKLYQQKVDEKRIKLYDKIERTIDLAQRVVELKALAAIEYAYGESLDNLEREKQALGEAKENILMKRNLTEIQRRIFALHDIATIPTTWISNLTKLVSRIASDPVGVVKDTGKGIIAAGNALGLGEALVADELLSRPNLSKSDYERAEGLLKKSDEKLTKTCSDVVSTLQHHPSLVLKEVAVSALEAIVMNKAIKVVKDHFEFVTSDKMAQKIIRDFDKLDPVVQEDLLKKIMLETKDLPGSSFAREEIFRNGQPGKVSMRVAKGHIYEFKVAWNAEAIMHDGPVMRMSTEITLGELTREFDAMTKGFLIETKVNLGSKRNLNQKVFKKNCDKFCQQLELANSQGKGLMIVSENIPQEYINEFNKKGIGFCEWKADKITTNLSLLSQESAQALSILAYNAGTSTPLGDLSTEQAQCAQQGDVNILQDRKAFLAKAVAFSAMLKKNASLCDYAVEPESSVSDGSSSSPAVEASSSTSELVRDSEHPIISEVTQHQKTTDRAATNPFKKRDQTQLNFMAKDMLKKASSIVADLKGGDLETRPNPLFPYGRAGEIPLRENAQHWQNEAQQYGPRWSTIKNGVKGTIGSDQGPNVWGTVTVTPGRQSNASVQNVDFSPQAIEANQRMWERISDLDKIVSNYAKLRDFNVANLTHQEKMNCLERINPELVEFMRVNPVEADRVIVKIKDILGKELYSIPELNVETNMLVNRKREDMSAALREKFDTLSNPEHFENIKEVYRSETSRCEIEIVLDLIEEAKTTNSANLAKVQAEQCKDLTEVNRRLGDSRERLKNAQTELKALQGDKATHAKGEIAECREAMEKAKRDAQSSSWLNPFKRDQKSALNNERLSTGLYNQKLKEAQQCKNEITALKHEIAQLETRQRQLEQGQAASSSSFFSEQT